MHETCFKALISVSILNFCCNDPVMFTRDFVKQVFRMDNDYFYDVAVFYRLLMFIICK